MRPALHGAARLAVGLTRVSTAEQGQSGLGLGTQQASVRAYAAARGWTLVAESPGGAGGKDDRRPGFQAARLGTKPLQLGSVTELCDAQVDHGGGETGEAHPTAASL